SAMILTILLLVIWEVAARMVNIMFILPSPIGIGVRLWELKRELFLNHLPATLMITLLGLSISIFLGVAIALLMKLIPMIERTIYPSLITSPPIPVTALAPIFVLWFGYSRWGKVVMTTLLTFFPITVSTIDGFRSSSKQMEELLLTMGASQNDIL